MNMVSPLRPATPYDFTTYNRYLPSFYNIKQSDTVHFGQEPPLCQKELDEAVKDLIDGKIEKITLGRNPDSGHKVTPIVLHDASKNTSRQQLSIWKLWTGLLVHNDGQYPVSWDICDRSTEKVHRDGIILPGEVIQPIRLNKATYKIGFPGTGNVDLHPIEDDSSSFSMSVFLRNQ